MGLVLAKAAAARPARIAEGVVLIGNEQRQAMARIPVLKRLARASSRFWPAVNRPSR